MDTWHDQRLVKTNETFFHVLLPLVPLSDYTSIYPMCDRITRSLVAALKS